ncbi:MAG: hypothetical protein PHV97_01005 [Candidatus Omnitrophica bacterium]|nr:hypothetical protein [Candidatus Omnitrophota bacterium]
MKKSFLFVLLLVLASSSPCLAAKTDDIRVKAEVDKAFLTIGDPVTYTVTAEHAPDIRILSEIPAPSSEILEIKKIEDIHKKEKKKIITGRKFILTTYRLGEFILDPVTVRYQKDGEPEKTIQTNKLYLTVKSVAGGDAQEDIRDVKSVVPYKLRMGKLLWTFLILALFISGYFLYRAFRKKQIVFQPGPPPLTPEEEAFLHLGELFESDLLKRGLIKLYYLRLSEVLRIYFEKRYKILAVELTTIETLRALRPLHLETGLYQKIQYVLESADLAKFAKWIPTAPEVLQINKKSEEIIKESIPVLEQALAENSHGV